ncbi:glycosyltransferase family 4 protein [Patescibacteria group bacterium]|nr:glycosyltransferase family 4 protein [Patescibacteria group bacterium]
MKILFITRKYPPQVGGMENYSYGLISNISCHKHIIALKHSRFHIIWFLPYAFLKSLFLFWRVDIIYLCDALLAPVGYLLKVITRKPVFVTAHGLDITYKKYFYQKINTPFLKKMDRVFAVSQNTVEECVKKGVKRKKCKFIPNGVDVPSEGTKYQRGDLEKFLDMSLENGKILLSVGRLIPRKGVEWFINNVVEKLPSEVVYIVAGEGPKREEIEHAVHDRGLGNRVFIVGRVGDEEREMLFQTADIFVMPNIRVDSDVEGFGIVAIEAAIQGLPVMASNIEGINDAIIEGHNGFLVESGNAQAFEEKIRDLLFKTDLEKLSAQIKDYTTRHYSWSYVSDLYLQEFKQWEKKKKAN